MLVNTAEKRGKTVGIAIHTLVGVNATARCTADNLIILRGQQMLCSRQI